MVVEAPWYWGRQRETLVRAVHSPGPHLLDPGPPSGPSSCQRCGPQGPSDQSLHMKQPRGPPWAKANRTVGSVSSGRQVVPPEPGNVSSSLSEGPPVGFQLASSPRVPHRAETSEEAAPSWEPSCGKYSCWNFWKSSSVNTVPSKAFFFFLVLVTGRSTGLAAPVLSAQSGGV